MSLPRPLSAIADVNPPAPSVPGGEDQVAFLPMAAVGSDGDGFALERRSYAEVAKGYTPFARGDILLAKITPCFENGKLAHIDDLPGGVGFGSTEFHVVRPHEGVNGRFLYHLLRAPRFRVDGANRMTGSAGQQRVPAQFLRDYPLIVPYDEAEQGRITAILDKADSIRARRRAALADTDALARATFLHLIGDPVTNPMAWPKTRIADVAEVAGGLTLNGARKDNPIEVAYLRVANVYRERLELSEIKTTQVTEAELVRTTLRVGDVLVVEGHGNPAEVGRAALWDGSIQQCAHQNHLIRVRPNRSTVAPSFVNAWLNSEAGRRQMVRAGKTTSGLNTISISQVRDLQLALPPLDRQQHFEAARSHLERIKRGLIASLADADALYASLAARAFRGEL